MVVVKVVEQDIADKIDTDFISDQFKELENIGIIFICTREGEEERDYIEDGMRYIVINLPYDEVNILKDARQMMLKKSQEKLNNDVENY